MNISLSPELETMIREKVEAGEYHDASEVVSEALRIMAQHDKRTKIRALRDDALAQAIAEADRGETVELTDELWDQLMAEGDARAGSERANRSPHLRRVLGSNGKTIGPAYRQRNLRSSADPTILD